MWYIESMKVKISVTLSEELLREVDRIVGTRGDRSALVELALRCYLSAMERKSRDARDLEILNDGASELNDEAADALSYQAEL